MWSCTLSSKRRRRCTSDPSPTPTTPRARAQVAITLVLQHVELQAQQQKARMLHQAALLASASSLTLGDGEGEHTAVSNVRNNSMDVASVNGVRVSVSTPTKRRRYGGLAKRAIELSGDRPLVDFCRWVLTGLSMWAF